MHDDIDHTPEMEALAKENAMGSRRFWPGGEEDRAASIVSMQREYNARLYAQIDEAMYRILMAGVVKHRAALLLLCK